MSDFEVLSEDEEIIWCRENGVKIDFSSDCEICGACAERIVKPPKNIDIELWVWEGVCYACKKNTPRVWVTPESIEGFEYSSLEPCMLENLKKEISKLYPFFKITNKMTQHIEEYGNVCIHCGAYQGDHYIVQEVLDRAYNQESLTEKRTITVELLENERLEYAFPHFFEFEIFKKNGDPRDGLEICKDCFKQIREEEKK